MAVDMNMLSANGHAGPSMPTEATERVMGRLSQSFPDRKPSTPSSTRRQMLTKVQPRLWRGTSRSRLACNWRFST
jgi:hypothetical protein